MVELNSQKLKKYLAKEEKVQTLFACGVDEMHLCGLKIAEQLALPSVVYFSGDLGAGKTTLIQGICQYFQYPGIVSSPSYNLIHEYPCSTSGVNIAHLDLYRLESPQELEMLGLPDLLNENSILLIEWPEKGSNYIPQYDVSIYISDFSDHEANQVGRQLEITYQ